MVVFDSTVMRAIQEELKKALLGTFITKVYQPVERDLVIITRGTKGPQKLLISCHPQYSRLNLTKAQVQNPPHPPNFCMVLRKHLLGGQMKKIEQVDFDRILYISVKSPAGREGEQERILVVEIIGRYSNVILIDPTFRIIDSLKHIPQRLNRYREILPERTYIGPPSQNRLDPFKIERNNFFRLFSSSSLQNVTQALVDNFQGISPLIAKEIVARAGNGGENLPLSDPHRLWDSFQEVITTISQGRFTPTVVRNEKTGNPVAFSAIELKQFKGSQEERYGSISEALEEFYSLILRQDEERRLKNSLKQTVARALEKQERTLFLQREEYISARDSEEYRIRGELITANIYRIKKGDSQVIVKNFYDPQEKEITIPLDPGLTPIQNAQRYFTRYNKAKRGLSIIKERLKFTQEEIAYLEQVKTLIEQASSLSELEEIEEELKKEGYLRDKQGATRGKIRPKKREIEPRRYISSEGYEILVGKNNRQNDYLVTKLASPWDLWLHAKELPGSHVIIRNPKGEEKIPEETLKEGALLAAYYSRGRLSSNVPVDYTWIRKINKPKGAKPGMVIYKDEKTLYLTPHLDLVKKIKEAPLSSS